MPPAERYLDLLAASLLDEIYLENEFRLIYLRRCVEGKETFRAAVCHEIQAHPQWALFRQLHSEGRFVDDDLDNLGFPYTMIGRRRLDHLHACLERVTADGVPGDWMECGVWRGGAAIFMRGYLAAHGITDRTVWLADSFEGLPPPSLPEDEGLDMSPAVYPMLAVSLETVREGFRRFHLLDGQVRFLKGWFRDTLPAAPVETLAVLRIDADLYESTRDALVNLYPKVSPGGYVIVDDYHCIGQCRQAVDEFRLRQGIEEPLEPIDWTAVCWRRSR